MNELNVDGVIIKTTAMADCPYCGERLYGEDDIKEHVRDCQNRPQLRGCFSCKHYRRLHNIEHCPANGIATIHGTGQQILTFQCEKWEAKDE